ncbi:MAG: WbqC family protein [Planctomycetaceae bacterium]
MRIGMMQPYFFPYLGYFGLIHATDRWIVFDTAQYIRRGWVNRNRVLSTNADGWNYVRVPIANCDRNTAIRDVRIDHRQNWRADLMNGLDTYRLRKAPCFDATAEFLEQTLAVDTDCLNDLLVHCLKCCCEYLELPLRCELFSELNLDFSDRDCAPGDWALETSRALGATVYINPPGGRSLFDVRRFEDSHIRLQFLQPALSPYPQGSSDFLPGLSIIDAMMWNRPADVRRLIGEYQLEDARDD